jgi:hypothetical protein
MFEVRSRARRTVVAALGLLLSSSMASVAAAAPKAETADVKASRLEQKSLKASAAGDHASAVTSLKQALRICEGQPPCTPKTTARLHVSLGTVFAMGADDYDAAKKEFTVALGLDPKARLRTHASRQLTTAFEDARTAAAAAGAAPTEKTPEPEKTDEKPPLSVSDLFHPAEPPAAAAPSPAPPSGSAAPAAPPAEPTSEARYNWLSLRAIADFAFLSDANICSPGAATNYYCTDENGVRYTGRPQPNNDVSPGFAASTARLVLGYERLLFGGLTAGALAGYAFAFRGSPSGRSALTPLHQEARDSYTFGSAPYADAGDRFNPFVFVSMGVAQIDSHVVIRVNEIPCGSRVSPACKRDLDVYRRLGNVFTTVGGGVRYRIEGRHGLRAAMRATMVFGEGGFVLSPELVYELGL